jgi:hypothetical protein
MSGVMVGTLSVGGGVWVGGGVAIGLSEQPIADSHRNIRPQSGLIDLIQYPFIGYILWCGAPGSDRFSPPYH